MTAREERLRRDAAELVARTTAASGVPLVVDDRAALLRVGHLVESTGATTDRRGAL